MAYLKAHRGDHETYAITLSDADGDPLDLDTVTEIWFTVRCSYGAAVDIEKTLTGGGITVTDADAGTAQITLDPEDTDDFPDRRVSYPYDVQVLSSTGDIATPIRGRIRVSPDVTTTTTVGG
jgi:hypothetical protein